MFWEVNRSKKIWVPPCVQIYIKSDFDPLNHYRSHGKEIFQVTQGRFGGQCSSI